MIELINEAPDLDEVLLALSKSWSDDQGEAAWPKECSVQADEGRHCALPTLAMDIKGSTLGRAVQHLDLPAIEHKAERILGPEARSLGINIIDELKLFDPPVFWRGPQAAHRLWTHPRQTG